MLALTLFTLMCKTRTARPTHLEAGSCGTTGTNLYLTRLKLLPVTRLQIRALRPDPPVVASTIHIIISCTMVSSSTKLISANVILIVTISVPLAVIKRKAGSCSTVDVITKPFTTQTASWACDESEDPASSFIPFIFWCIGIFTLLFVIRFIYFKLITSIAFADRSRRVCGRGVRGRGVVMAISRICGSTTTSNVYCRDVDNNGNSDGEPFQLNKLENRTSWTNEEVTNERLQVGSVVRYQQYVLPSLTASKQFIYESIGGKQQDITNLQFGLLQNRESVYRGLKKAHGYINPKACTRVHLIQIRAGTILNETVTLETMDKEWLNMPLNCRESLLLSATPVQLQLKTADDEVDGVAIVKCKGGEFTCEGLISRYKPYIISRDDEPVEIQNGYGKMIPVSRHGRVLFDTGNEAATGISRKLLLKLKLKPDPTKKEVVELAGGRSDQFETAEIELIIRGHHFKVNALVGATAKGTDLLVGYKDVIETLYGLGYTIGI